jgi:glycosyltransferase involved in cell wall biosynthesis
MKVMFATYPMAFHTPGGGEMQLLAYQRHLPRHDVEVSLFNEWEPRFLEHDIIHFFSCIGGSSHFCAFVKQLGLPLVISSSLWITERNKQDYPIDEIRYQLTLADRVITNSEMESDTLADVLSLPRKKFSSVYNGVEESFFDPSAPECFRSRFGLTDRFVLCVGNIEPRKNQLRLAAAMRALPSHKLVLIGHLRAPDYYEQLKSLAGEQLLYLGPLDHQAPELRAAYAACDVFCLPSTLETPGLAALEAAAAGARIVITREGSTQEYFGDTATYVDPESPNKIAEGIRSALAQPASATCRDLVYRYVWNATTQKLADLYREVVERV